MFITTQNEIISLMPTARWTRPDQLFGYLEEEERVALEPLLGTRLYSHLCSEYERLRGEYIDLTATTVKPTGRAKEDPRLPHADVTARIEAVHRGYKPSPCDPQSQDEIDVPKEDLQTIRLLRICQQIEFYKMLSHKAGLLTVSFNEGGGMNIVTADGYDPTDEKRMERVVKDAWMSAGRAIDSLLLFLEADAKGDRLFTELWQEADAFYLHRDLLFQTARVLNEYLDIKSERMAYVALVRDIRFCQATYLKPRVGAGLLRAVVNYANVGMEKNDNQDRSASPLGSSKNQDNTDGDESASGSSAEDRNAETSKPRYNETLDELLSLLRTALAFYVESRRTSMTTTGTLTTGSANRSTSTSFQKEERLARRDSMTDAQQAMAMAEQYIEDNLEALGEAAIGSPIYTRIKAQEAQAKADAECACRARERQRQQQCQQSRKKLFTAFPSTHRIPELK